MNLDIVSRIDDEIIEKNTVKRANLLMGKGKRNNKKLVLLLVAVITLIALMASTLIVLLLPNGDDGQPTPPVEPVEKQVPIYQGMSISDEIVKTQPVSAAAPSNISFLCATGAYDYRFDWLGSEQGAGNSHENNGNGQGNNGDNGNHNGHNKKPAKDIIDDNITITIPAQEMYTAQPNQDIYITVHISNPDSFEIMSFTLNGKKYSSYMFEDGSDMENLILKVNVGEAEGLVEYTIDAIKYIDGTEIKDVIMDGDRTVKVGVYSEKQPTATITDEVIGINKMSFKVTVKDILGLLEITEGKLYAVLLDGETLIEKVELTVGEEKEIVFENLKTATYYQYAIVACYDRFDGDGYGRYLLADKEFYTEGIMAFDSVEIGQESISYSVIWNEDFENKTLASLKLYHGDALLRELDTAATEIIGLLSNCEYTLIATYVNGENTESTELAFVTKEKKVPTVAVELDSVSDTSISFNAVVVDDDKVGEITKIELIHGEDVQNITDLGTREFTSLLSNNTYTVKVTYTYDLNDGAGEHTIVKTVDVTTEAKAIPEIAISEASKTQTSLGFDIAITDVDSVGAITKLELIHGEDVQNITDLGTREFTSLLSNNTYTVKVTYTYDLNDGAGEQTIEKTVDITTEAKATPEITITETSKTHTSLGFDIAITDVDSVGAITKLELIHGEDLQNITDLSTREFTSLLSNNTYTVKVTYTYDLNDGVGEQTIEKTVDITTEAKAEPTFTFKNMASELYSISGEYDVSNIDNTLISYKLELYRGDELVEENTDKEIAFDNLDYYTDYTAKITYTFDANDGKGVQTKTAEYAIKTLPYIDVTECKIANTSAVSEGDTIFMQVKLDNPLNMSVESVVVNGETYNVTGASTTNKIFVEIVYNGQFEGGDTYLKVDKVNAKIDTTTLAVDPKTELSDNVFINGKLEVLSFTFVNENLEPIDWTLPSQKSYLLITFSNPTGYKIDSVTIEGYGDGSKLIRVDNNTYYCETTGLYGSNGSIYDDLYGYIAIARATQVTYSNDYLSKTTSFSLPTASLYILASDEIHYISTPTDLLDMDDDYYYELKNDIDLSGTEWLGNEFKGVFDGKGYSIENMSFVGTIKNADAYLGLFSRGKGLIKDLNIKEATIIAEVTSDDGNGYDACCGAFLGSASRITLSNCTVDNNSIFTVNNKCPFGASYVGGVIGNVSNSSRATIEYCTNNAIVTGEGENSYAGGLVGSFRGDGVISNSTNNGSVTAQHMAGGLTGELDGVVISCANNGHVNVNSEFSRIGGVAGWAAEGCSTINNCVNSGILTAINNISGYIGGLVGEGDINCVNITNSYSLTTGHNLHEYTDGIACTIDQLNSKEFYTETLGWSEEIWDFSELDVENGKYPKLK